MVVLEALRDLIDVAQGFGVRRVRQLGKERQLDRGVSLSTRPHVQTYTSGGH